MALDEFEVQNLAQQMAAQIEAEVEEQGYSLHPFARETLRKIVASSVMRVGISQGLLPRDVSEVQASVTRLARELAKESSARIDSENVIDENIVSTVMAKLCPGFWPFC